MLPMLRHLSLRIGRFLKSFSADYFCFFDETYSRVMALHTMLEWGRHPGCCGGKFFSILSLEGFYIVGKCETLGIENKNE